MTADQEELPIVVTTSGAPTTYGSGESSLVSKAPAPDPRRYLVLLAFAIQSACNSFMFMDYATVATESRALLGGIDDEALNWLYSVSLITCMPFTPFAAWLVHQNFQLAIGFLMLTNLAGAWLRYTAALYSSYMCAVISSCCIGAAASVVICSFAYVPEQYFGTEERTLATALAVQSNYFGWALGCVLVPAIIHGADYVSDFQTFSLVQAVILTSSLLFFPVFKKTSKHEQEAVNGEESHLVRKEASDHHETDASTGEQLCRLIKNPRYVILAICAGALTGAGYAIPAVQDEILTNKSIGMSETLVSWANFAFVAAGVVTGLSLGNIVRRDQYDIVLRGIFLLASVAVSAVTVLAYYPHWFSSNVFSILLLVFASLAGAATLGGTSIALNSAVRLFRNTETDCLDVSEAYSAGMVEWLIQGWGGGLTFLCTGGASGFAMIAAALGASTILLIGGDLIFPPKKSVGGDADIEL